MKRYDSIIIGAGPAGLRCAEILAKAKKRVLVLEKKKIIGPKICAGGVSLKTLNYGIPEKLFEKKFNQFKYYNKDKSITIKSKKPFLAMLDRKKLGQWQANNAKKAGAMIKTGSKVTSIGKDYVVVSNKEIYFKTLVGADGVGSIVRNHLGLKNNKIHLTMQYIIQGNFKELEIHFDSKICKEGYKWVFPHKGWASIGIGFDPKRNDIKKVRENFNIWLENKGIDTKKAKFESMPILYDYQGFRFGNIFLAGEAAGLTYGLTGEGIYPALASGEEVAKIIIDKNFNPILIPKILRKKKIQEILITIITRCSFLGVLLHTLGFWLMKRKKWQSKAIRLTLS